MSETVGQAIERQPGRIIEAIRDIPRSCLCIWELRPGNSGFRRTFAKPGCPWHLSGEWVPWSAEKAAR